MARRGRRLDRGDALVLEQPDGRATGRELAALDRRAFGAAGRLESLAGADDEVALGGRRVVLQGGEQPTDVGAPLRLVDDVGEPGVEALQLVAGGLAVTAGGDVVDLVADPLDGLAHRLQPGAHLGAGRLQGQPGAQRRGHRVGEAAGLGQRQREGAGGGGRQRAGGGPRFDVEPAPDQGGDALGLPGADPAVVEGDLEQVVPVGDRLPERHRDEHVAAERVAFARRQRRGVQRVQLVLALVPPHGEVAQEDERLLRRDRRPQPAGRLGGATGGRWGWRGQLERHGRHDRP